MPRPRFPSPQAYTQTAPVGSGFFGGVRDQVVHGGATTARATAVGGSADPTAREEDLVLDLYLPIEE